MSRTISSLQTGIYRAEGPRPTTFGPVAWLDQRPVFTTLTAVVALAAEVGVFALAWAEAPVVVCLLGIVGFLIGYLTYRRRSPRPLLQIGLAAVLPGLLAAFFVYVSVLPAAVIASAGLVPATVLGHLVGRGAERLLGPRRKVLQAAWAEVTLVGSRNRTDGVFFDVSPLFTPVSRDDARVMRRSVGKSPLETRAAVFRWLFIIVGPVLALALVAGFIDEATKGGERVASQLFGLSAFTLLLALTYGTIAWFGFRGGSQSTAPADHVRLARFASRNGFGYTPGPVTDRFGHALSRVMTLGTPGQRPQWILANSSRTEPDPRESSAPGTLFSGFCEFRVPVPLPNLVLQSRRPRLPSFSAYAAPSPSQRLSLEGDFDRFFTLYTPKGYERDALYILTPDVMGRLIDGVHGFDVEFIDDRLVLRTPDDMVAFDPAKWQRIAIAVNALNDRVQQWARWRDDRRDDRHEAESISGAPRLLTEKPTGAALAGRRLRLGLGVGAVLTVAFGAIFLSLTLISNAL